MHFSHQVIYTVRLNFVQKWYAKESNLKLL